MKKFLSRFSYPIELFLPKSEKLFLIFIVSCFVSALFGVIAGPKVGMWVGFAFAAYAAVANDSIQTIGTFIASNQDKKWWVLWLFLGSIFLGTISYSWLTVDKTGITVFYPNEKSNIYTKTDHKGNITNWTKDDFKKLDSFLENKLKLDIISEDNGQTVCQISSDSEKIFFLTEQRKDESDIIDTLSKIQFTKDKFYGSNKKIETYGLSFLLLQNGTLNAISQISYNTDSLAIYSFGGDSQIFYEDGKINYTQAGKVFYEDGITDGDVTSARLSAKGFEQSPSDFHFLHIAAPIFLLILTRLRMPVSTTFILLTSFATSTKAIGGVLAKSMSGYILAFFIGLLVFVLISRLTKKYFTGKASFKWTIAQWVTSGTLWSVWLMQDAANIAVYLNRGMSFWSFFGFCFVIFIGLGLLLYYKGGRIQRIVTEKSVVTDVRFATIIDFIYCIILFYFKLHSEVPMSTTWVFIGLLGGRELGMAIRKSGTNSMFKTGKLIIKDFSFALIGLIISIAIAIGVNDGLTVSSVVNDLPSEFLDGLYKFFNKLGIG